MRSAVLDNTTLRALYRLNLIEKLNLLYNEVWIPREVEKEFLNISDITEVNHRFSFLFDFYERHKSWFKQCNVYNDIDISIFESTLRDNDNLHRGEIEAVVQHNQLPGSNIEILLDDRSARKFLARSLVIHHGTLYILAHLHINLGACDYHASVEILKKDGQRFSKGIVRKVFKDIQQNLL